MILWKAMVVCFCSFVFLLGKATASATSIYEVKKGDTLWVISNNLNLDFKELIDHNPQLNNPNIIFPGDIINIPRKKENKSSRMLSKIENELLMLANEKRSHYGLQPLSFDEDLSNAAELKALDMKNNEYVAHTSPTYGNPTHMLRNLNIPFYSVKENIGAGQLTAQEVFEAWMRSYIHRESLLDKNATHIGIGYAEGGLHGHYWTTFIVQK